MASDDTHLWVQWGEQVARVGARGVEAVAEAAGLDLLAAGGPGA